MGVYYYSCGHISFTGPASGLCSSCKLEREKDEDAERKRRQEAEAALARRAEEERQADLRRYEARKKSCPHCGHAPVDHDTYVRQKRQAEAEERARRAQFELERADGEWQLKLDERDINARNLALTSPLRALFSAEWDVDFRFGEASAGNIFRGVAWGTWSWYLAAFLWESSPQADREGAAVLLVISAGLTIVNLMAAFLSLLREQILAAVILAAVLAGLVAGPLYFGDMLGLGIYSKALCGTLMPWILVLAVPAFIAAVVIKTWLQKGPAAARELVDCDALGKAGADSLREAGVPLRDLVMGITRGALIAWILMTMGLLLAGYLLTSPPPRPLLALPVALFCFLAAGLPELLVEARWLHKRVLAKADRYGGLTGFPDSDDLQCRLMLCMLTCLTISSICWLHWNIGLDWYASAAAASVWGAARPVWCFVKYRGSLRRFEESSAKDEL